MVDDGSPDKTLETAAAVAAESGQAISLLRNEINKGKGYSVRRGVLAAKGRRVFFTDADLSTPIDEINKFLPILETAHIAVGSRALAGSDIVIHQPFHREMMGRVFNIFVQAVAVRGIKDTQCGFKGFSRQAAQETFCRQRLNGFGFDVEVLYIAQKLGFSIAEIPITWKNSAASRVSPVQDGLGMLGDLARVRINDLKGAYGRSTSPDITQK